MKLHPRNKIRRKSKSSKGKTKEEQSTGETIERQWKPKNFVIVLDSQLCDHKGTEDSLTCIGSSVDRLTFKPRLKNLGKGLSMVFLKSELLLSGETASPTWHKM